jgi:hypothetical protein
VNWAPIQCVRIASSRNASYEVFSNDNLFAEAVIGSDGFGVAYNKLPQANSYRERLIGNARRGHVRQTLKGKGNNVSPSSVGSLPDSQCRVDTLATRGQLALLSMKILLERFSS